MYIIYEIKTKKIGCTHKDKFDMRQHQQSKKGKMIVLEEHTCIYKASEREIELQKKYGYPVDKHPYWYTVTVQNKLATTPEARNKAVQNTDYKARVAKTDYYSEKQIAARKTAKEMDAMRALITPEVYEARKVSIVAIDKKGNKTVYDGIKDAADILTKKTGIKFYKETIGAVANPKYYNQSHRGYTFEYA
jgi:hypothetical protein